MLASLRRCIALTTPAIRSRDDLACLGLLMYGVYTVFSNLRHTTGHCSSTGAAYGAICQAIREGSRGHTAATKALQSRWINHERTLAQIPPPPLLHLSENFTVLEDFGTSSIRTRGDVHIDYV